MTNSHSLCSTSSSTRNNVTPFSEYQELLIDIKAPTRRRIRRLRAATRKLSRQILVQFTTRDFILKTDHIFCASYFKQLGYKWESVGSVPVLEKRLTITV